VIKGCLRERVHARAGRNQRGSRYIRWVGWKTALERNTDENKIRNFLRENRHTEEGGCKGNHSWMSASRSVKEALEEQENKLRRLYERLLR